MKMCGTSERKFSYVGHLKRDHLSVVLFLRSFFFNPFPPPSLGTTYGLFPLLVFRIPEVAEKRRKRHTSRRFTMDTTLETIARWKTTTRGTSACKVLELDVRGKTVGEAFVALRNSGHESLPTGAETSSTMTMVSQHLNLFGSRCRFELMVLPQGSGSLRL